MPPKKTGNHEEMILKILENSVNGACPEPYLKQKLKIDDESRCKAVNNLLKKGRLELKTQGQTLIYSLRSTSSSSLTKDLTSEEKVVHKLIEESGNKGVWVKDIRVASNIQHVQLNKVLKNLESKKVIKSVKPVNDSKKKVYMLFDIQPDSSLTGGAWYSDSDFETEFVDILSRQTLRFLQQQRSHSELQHSDPLLARKGMSCDVKQVKNFISQLGISKGEEALWSLAIDQGGTLQVDLSVEEVYQILDTLVSDGVVCRTVTMGVNNADIICYYALKYPPISSGLARVPCNNCSLINECSFNGVISPLSCKYMKDWLDF